VEEQANNNFDVPPNLIIDNLRNEIARLNDERITLAIKLQFQNDIIVSLQQQLEQSNSSNSKEETTQINPE
jgi:hypothetical protein